jgi:hypothetical protein
LHDDLRVNFAAAQCETSAGGAPGM